MPNIRILVKAILQIFCSQGCSYTKCLCPKMGNNSTQNLRNRFKIESVHLHLSLYFMSNIRILAKAVLQIFCSQGCSYTKCLCPKKGYNSTENLWNRFKVNQFIYNLVCNYMPNIRILALAVLQIFCSQGCSYIVEKGA